MYTLVLADIIGTRNYKFRSITVINDAYVLEFAIGLPEFAFIRPSALSTSIARVIFATMAAFPRAP